MAKSSLRPTRIEWPEYWLGRLFSWRHWEEHARAWEREVQRAFIAEYSPCPCCGQSVAQHAYALLAHAIHRPEASPTEKALRTAVARRDWAEAAAIREGNYSEDLLRFEVVHCPGSGDLGLYEVIAYHELVFDDAHVSRTVLAAEDAAQVLGLLPQGGAHWVRFALDA